MNYQETIDFLFSSLPMYQRSGFAAYKANLDNTLALDKALNHPHTKFKSIHVAGTNGKGSVSHMLASVLQEAGYKTGLYTSPHLLDFRERIRINGNMISENAVVSFVKKIKVDIENIQPSFFEMTVAMALDYFAANEVDVAIVETGMGGRLDSTNIITPELSIITSISMDHSEFLGNTPQLIAAEKGGIIKENIPLITGQQDEDVKTVLSDIAGKKNAKLTNAAREYEFKFRTTSLEGTAIFHFALPDSDKLVPIESDLKGNYQADNIAIVLSTLDCLQKKKWQIKPQQKSRGLKLVRMNTGLKGRWDILGANPRIICDTAHNYAGIREVINQLQQIPYEKLHIIWGMVGDKDITTLLSLLPTDAKYYFCAASIPRSLPVEDLSAAAAANNIQHKTFSSVGQAFRNAKKLANANDLVFIGGSTFIVADLLEYLESESG